MRIIGNTLHTLAAAAIIAAIWSPIGTWWQWLASALLLWLAGAIIHASTQLAKAGLDQPASADGTDTNGNPLSADSPALRETERLAGEGQPGNSTGPHLRIKAGGASAKEVMAALDGYSARQAALHQNRPTYGKQADS